MLTNRTSLCVLNPLFGVCADEDGFGVLSMVCELARDRQDWRNDATHRLRRLSTTARERRNLDM